MPFKIIRNDIANVSADAIVNTANPRPIVGPGTDAAIHHKAGSALLEVRQKIGDIPVGQCALTPAFQLDAKYVIHTVGPVWQGGIHNERQLLENCFQNALQMALEHNCSSIAFPLISAGAYGFPRQEALQIAIQSFSRFLMEHEMQIYLVVWDKESYLLSQSLFHDVTCYIDEHYIEQNPSHLLYSKRYSLAEEERRHYDAVYRTEASVPPLQAPASPSKTSSRAPLPLGSRQEVAINHSILSTSAHRDASLSTLDQLLENTDAGFSETLLKLIDETGKKDSEIYKKANVSKQHFSKIRNNPDYKPTKATAVAFAIALELDLEQTRDLIGRAGYALTNSSKFDVIIMYFISRGHYNMFDINMTLFQFDQMTLGV